MTGLIIFATIRPVAGFESDVEDALIRAASVVKSESGCLQYDVGVSPVFPVEYFLIERWTSQQTRHAHENGLAFEKLSNDIAGKASVRIKMLNPL